MVTLQGLLVISLSACAVQDDFGRSHSPKLRENALDIVGSIQEHTGVLSRDAAYHIPFTGDEITLRMSMKHFQQPFMYNPTLRHPNDSQTFSKHRSAEGFLAYIQHNLRSDRSRIRHIGPAIDAVIKQDTQRYEVVASNYDVRENDSRYIRVRIRENRAVTRRILQLLDRRIAHYDKAIEYARLQYPDKVLQGLSPAMDSLRAQHGILKSRYENYVYSQASKDQRSQFDTEQRPR